MLNSSLVQKKSRQNTLPKRGEKFLTNQLQNVIWFFGTLIYRYWFKLTTTGRENLPVGTPYIIAANHASHLDGPAIVAAQGIHYRNVYSLAAKDYFFNNLIKSWLFASLLNMIPFDRCQRFSECFPVCRQLVNQNKVILFFPEGTRSVTGKLQRFKRGLAPLLLHLNVPIVPVYVKGTFEALPKGKNFPERYPIHVSFGEIIMPDKYLQQSLVGNKKQLYKEIIEDVQKAIEQMAILLG